jgi:hypothetical protein
VYLEDLEIQSVGRWISDFVANGEKWKESFD